MLNDLIAAHAASLKTWLASAAPGEDLETECESYELFERAEHAFVVYQCITADEVQQKLAYVAECQTLANAVEVDLCKEFMASIRLSPTDVSLALARTIADWRRAEDRYRIELAIDPAKDHEELWHAKDDAEMAMLREPCHSSTDIRAKIQIALSDDSVFDTLGTSTYNEEPVERVLKIFLRSLIGEGVPEAFDG